ncbi:MAG TPA: hypothetical protein VGM80_18085 [Gaiellaceae bacterium]
MIQITALTRNAIEVHLLQDFDSPKVRVSDAQYKPGGCEVVKTQAHLGLDEHF